MLSNAHSIRTLSLEVNCAGKANGLALLEEASLWANQVLLPQIEEVFAAFPDSRELIQIDRLELNLSASSASDWGHEILGRLKSDLSAMLARIAAGRTPIESEEKPSPNESFFRHLVYFLREGILPWSSPIRSRDDWHEAFTRWLSSGDPANHRAELVELLAEPASRFRFVHSISVGDLQKAMVVLFAVPERIWRDWAEDGRRLPPTAQLEAEATPTESSAGQRPDEVLIKRLTQMLFEKIAAHGFTYTRDLEVEAVTQVLTQMLPEQRITARTLKPLKFSSAAFSEAREIIVQASSAQESTRHFLNPLARSVETATDLEAAIHLPPGKMRKNAVQRLPQSERPAAEGIYVSNAGTVLVAPFLTTFFDRVGVAKDRQLTKPELAMSLIHYLATGRETAAEFELILPKILCGWELEEPVELPDSLPGEMKDEANQLLAAMIEHWSILKNTSPDGLRESFLNRQGKVTLNPRDEWLLQVEQKSFDMLLQQLPWSFQLIKLPWMNRLLRTDWVY